LYSFNARQVLKKQKVFHVFRHNAVRPALVQYPADLLSRVNAARPGTVPHARRARWDRRALEACVQSAAGLKTHPVVEINQATVVRGIAPGFNNIEVSGMDGLFYGGAQKA